jgi:hypothetical protein
MSTRNILCVTGAVVLSASFAGCVATTGGEQSARLTDNFQVYAPFDNERSWGPSFLVGPPDHHLGDQNRIDDTRAIQGVDEPTPADPRTPPLP